MPGKDSSSAPTRSLPQCLQPPAPGQPGCPVPDCQCAVRCLPGYLTPENYRRCEPALIRLGMTTGRPAPYLTLDGEPEDAPEAPERRPPAPQPWEPRPPRRRGA